MRRHREQCIIHLPAPRRSPPRPFLYENPGPVSFCPTWPGRRERKSSGRFTDIIMIDHADRNRSTTADQAVVTQGLTRRFGSLIALNNVEFTLPSGAILGLLGPNGSGKTTLLSILAGFLAPTAGEFRLLGETNHRAALARTGSLISRPLLWPHLSCRDNLRCLQMIYTGQQNKELVEQLLEQVGLSDGAARKFGQCSTGMKQRLGLAAALVNDPQLLLLDEPTNGLDPEGMVEIRELVQQLGRSSGRSIIMSSHLLNEVERTCDHYAIIYRGHLVSQGSLDAAAESRPLTSMVTTNNARAIAHLEEKGWQVMAGDAANGPPEAFAVATMPGAEWQPARDLAEIGVFPTSMTPAAPAPASASLEAIYLAAVGRVNSAGDGAAPCPEC